MTRPSLVIFDCDGVLVDSETVSNRVLADNLARHGLRLSLADTMATFIGRSMVGVRDTALDMGAELPGDWIDLIYAETYAALRAGVEVIAGIPALLDRLDATGIPYCVASNGSAEKMDITLGQTGLAPRFDGRRWSAHELGVAKPDPGLFFHAAAAEGVAPPGCVVVEDSASGAEAAHRAGMRCLGYVPEGHPDRLSAWGATVIRRMDAVAAHIGLGPDQSV
ncbi:HAD-IA family hydrolase [Roseicyclus persicicus]|uniref:HAD-IA family hydrolase n=1 Tax=Roseicyclus persicicus TaxID=2650661 RepID=A0A7X6H0N6_9RHOB|nr:HAD-IA family hydrolase [Roseibacterium persicicum]